MRVTKDGRRLFGIVQAEDELAAIGVAIGGGWNGARSFTATSGPGISLMSEFLGLAYFAEVPVVLFNIQRGGPSTGMPTRTQQSDIISCAYASHGDTKHVLLFPANPTECFSMGAQAFDLAERLQTPVIVMSDLDIGMNDWVTEPFAWDDAHVHDRGKVLDAETAGEVQGDQGQGLGPLPGRRRRRHPLPHAARHASDQGRLLHARHLARRERPLHRGRPSSTRACSTASAASSIRPPPSCRSPRSPSATRAARPASIYFGATTPAMREALDLLEREGVKVNALRIKAFPFSRDVASFCAMHERVFVVEQNRDAQMRSLLMTEANVPRRQADPRAQLRRHAARPPRSCAASC